MPKNPSQRFEQRMGYEVVWTDTYERELLEVIRYHIEVLKSPAAAKALLPEIENAIDLLAVSPGLKAVSSKRPFEALELREWYIKNYVLVYRSDDSRVYIEHLFHQSQDYERMV